MTKFRLCEMTKTGKKVIQYVKNNGMIPNNMEFDTLL